MRDLKPRVKSGVWKTVSAGETADGRPVEMKYATFGRGRAKMHSWKIFVDGEQVDYATNVGDADENFRRAVAGLPNGRDGSRLDLL